MQLDMSRGGGPTRANNTEMLKVGAEFLLERASLDSVYNA
jgi:hypothetical protein